MTLWRCIRKEISNGNLDEEFGAVDLINLQNRRRTIGGQFFKESTLRTMLANFAVGEDGERGALVKDIFAEPRFRRVKRGRYVLMSSEDKVPEGKGPSERERVPTGSDVRDPDVSDLLSQDRLARAYVEYISKESYQVRLVKEKEYYPVVPALGWLSRRDAYRWQTRTWAETTQVLQRIERRLVVLRASVEKGEHKDCPEEIESQAIEIYNEIKKWGNPRGPKYTGREILNFLQDVWIDKPKCVNSSLTKMYALAMPDAYVMYDSRVAAAIISIAESIIIYDHECSRDLAVAHSLRKAYPALGRIHSKYGTRGRKAKIKWPNAYRCVQAQHQANDLCVRIKDYLNKVRMDKSGSWTLRDVEAVLFMEGY